MQNKYFTLLLIPEKTSKIRRLMIPHWVVKSAFLFFVFATLLLVMMFFNYWYVMSRIQENKDLRVENRRLRQEVQTFKNRTTSMEQTLDRVERFATRLRVITNIEDHATLLQSTSNSPLPDASRNIGINIDTDDSELAASELPELEEMDPNDPEYEFLIHQHQMVDKKFGRIRQSAIVLEQNLQDLYEILIDQRDFLAALPTRKPAPGYYTSGFGIRPPPLEGGRVKMHEGVDIANHPGTQVVATANGEVRFASGKPGYGRTVIIDHGYGIETWYAHARKILVNNGQKVRRGTPIALMGTTGRSTGSHVHYEVRVHGIPVDPLSYILEE